MTSTNDGKEVKSNQTSGHKGKSYYIELYKSLDAQLNGDSELSERVAHLSNAWRRVHTLCLHSAPTTHPFLLSWIQRHTARTVLQSEWQSPKGRDEHAKLIEAFEAFCQECRAAATNRNGAALPWESQLQARAEWFKGMVDSPWGHPVLKLLLDPKAQRPTTDDILEWLREERGVVFAARLRQLALAKCDDLALTLLTNVMDRARLGRPPTNDFAVEAAAPEPQPDPPTFHSVLDKDAGFAEVWDLLTDMELVLLHKSERNTRLIDLAKQTPLVNGYQLVERLINRLESSPKEKKIWKNAKDVALLVAQVMITRCMVVPQCMGEVRKVLYWCSRALVRVLPPRKLGSCTLVLAAPASTARHLHALAAAVHQQCAESEELRPFVVELYVRAITFGMNELEKLKLKPEYEAAEARSTEQTLSSWFIQLGQLLSGSARLRGECVLTAFSVHPSAQHFERIRQSPLLQTRDKDTSPIKDETETTANSWAKDSHSQTNFVKTSETLNLKQTQHLANVMSTAILNEGEALGLNPELCQDIIVLLSGPRVKTLSCDMDRETLLENCRAYMERTGGGTRALTTELKYLNLDLRKYQHLPEEQDNEDDLYYGIEKGYEHLVEFEPQPEKIWEDALDPEHTDTAESCYSEDEKQEYKKTIKSQKYTSESDSDPLSIVAEHKRERAEKKERPHSKERSSSKEPKKHEDTKIHSKHSHCRKKKDKKERKKEKKERKKMEKKEAQKAPPHSMSHLVGVKVTLVPPEEAKGVCGTDSDYDSQGKSSMQSEGNDEYVVYDGQFSMDELKSPTKRSPEYSANLSRELNSASRHITKALINQSSGLRIQGNVQGKPSESASVQAEDSKAADSATAHTEPAKPVPSADIKTLSREELKKNITKLIQFRKQKSAEARSATDANSKSTTSLSSLIGTKLQNTTHLSFYNSQMEHTPSMKDEAIGCPNTTHSPTTQQKKSPSACSRTQPFHPSKKRLSLGQRALEIYKDPTILNNAMTQYSQMQANKPQIADESGQSSHLSCYQDFLKELGRSSLSGLSVVEEKRREMKPISRVIPIVPKAKPDPVSTVPASPADPSPKSEPTAVSSQCAKPNLPKKVETAPNNAPNTFARLSYMHKNKLNEKPKLDPNPALNNSVSEELDRRIAELRMTNISMLMNKHDKTVNSGNVPSKRETSKAEIQALEQPNMTKCNIRKDHPVLSNILKNNLGATASVSCNAEPHIAQAEGRTIAMKAKQSSLSEKDHQDILKLLGQKSRMQTQPSDIHMINTKNQSNTVSGKCISGPSKPSSVIKSVPSENLKQNNEIKARLPINIGGTSFQFPVISNTTILKTTAMIQDSKVLPVQQTQLNQSKSKVKGKHTQKAKNKSPQVDPTNVSGLKKLVSKKYVPKPPQPTPQFNEDAKEQDWAKVLDALRSQKTPTRGPNALDMTLNKDVDKNLAIKSPIAKKVEDFISSVLEQQVAEQNKTCPNIKRQTPSQIPTKSASVTFKLDNFLTTELEKQIAQQSNISSNLVRQSTTKSTGATPKIIQKHPKEKDIPKKPSKADNKKPTSSNHQMSSPKATKQQIETQLLKQDPFISGIQNSDYDILEELLDDDLRKEIGELSSDEDNYDAAAMPAKEAKHDAHKNIHMVNIKSNVPSKPKLTIKPKIVMEKSQAKQEMPTAMPQSASQKEKPRILSNEKVDIRDFASNILPLIRNASNSVVNKPQDVTICNMRYNSQPVPQAPANVQSSSALHSATQQSSGQNVVIHDPFGVATLNQNFVPVQNSSKLVYQPYSPNIGVNVANQVIINTGTFLVPAINVQPTALNITFNAPTVVTNTPNFNIPMNEPVIGITACEKIVPMNTNQSQICDSSNNKSNQKTPILNQNVVKGMKIENFPAACKANTERPTVITNLEGTTKSTGQRKVKGNQNTAGKSKVTLPDKIIIARSTSNKVTKDPQIQAEKPKEMINSVKASSKKESVIVEDADKKRIAMKRQAIINRQVHNYLNYPSIQLPYSPLFAQTGGYKKGSSEVPERSEPEIKNHEDLIKNKDENEDMTGCRRILLRSSNKIADVATKNDKLGRKSTVRLKDLDYDEIKDLQMVDELSVLKTKSVSEIAAKHSNNLVKNDFTSIPRIDSKLEENEIKIENKHIKSDGLTPLSVRKSKRILSKKIRKSKTKEAKAKALEASENILVTKLDAIVPDSDQNLDIETAITGVKISKAQHLKHTLSVDNTLKKSSEKAVEVEPLFESENSTQKEAKKPKPLTESNIKKEKRTIVVPTDKSNQDIDTIEIISSPEIDPTNISPLTKMANNLGDKTKNIVQSIPKNGSGSTLDEIMAPKPLDVEEAEGVSASKVTKTVEVLNSPNNEIENIQAQSLLIENKKPVQTAALVENKSSGELFTCDTNIQNDKLSTSTETKSVVAETALPKAGTLLSRDEVLSVISPIGQKLSTNSKLTKLVNDIESALSVITETTVSSPIIDTLTDYEKHEAISQQDAIKENTNNHVKLSPVLLGHTTELTTAASEPCNLEINTITVDAPPISNSEDIIQKNAGEGKISEASLTSPGASGDAVKFTSTTPIPVKHDEMVKVKNTVSLSVDSDIKIMAVTKESSAGKGIDPSLCQPTYSKFIKSKSDDLQTKDTTVGDTTTANDVKNVDEEVIQPQSIQQEIIPTVSLNVNSDVESAREQINSIPIVSESVNSNIADGNSLTQNDIPQSYKDSIRIVEVPIPGNTNPFRRAVKITLPNKRQYKATVHGNVTISFDSLFEEPTLKNILLSNLRNKKSYTLSIKQPLQGPPKPMETVNLISDDEDEPDLPLQVIQTATGSYKIRHNDNDMFKNHQEKLARKCTVTIPRCDDRSKPDSLVEALINDLLPSAAEEMPSEVIEIDDSASDDELHGLPKIVALKDLLLKDLGVESTQDGNLKSNENLQTILPKVIVLENKRLSRARKSKYHRERDPITLIIPEMPFSQTKRDKSVTSAQSDDDENEDHYDYSQIIKRECYIELVRCDAMIKNKDDDDSLQDNETAFSDVDGTDLKNVSLSRRGSLSLLNDLETLDVPVTTEIVGSSVVSADLYVNIGRSSPVMEVYDMIVAFREKSSVVRDINADQCISDWFHTKRNLHFEQSKVKSSILRDINADQCISDWFHTKRYLHFEQSKVNSSIVRDINADQCISDWFHTKRNLHFEQSEVKSSMVRDINADQCISDWFHTKRNLHFEQSEVKSSIVRDINADQCISDWFHTKRYLHFQQSKVLKIEEDIINKTDVSTDCETDVTDPEPVVTDNEVSNNDTVSSLQLIMAVYFANNDIVNVLKPLNYKLNSDLPKTSLKRKKTDKSNFISKVLKTGPQSVVNMQIQNIEYETQTQEHRETEAPKVENSAGANEDSRNEPLTGINKTASKKETDSCNIKNAHEAVANLQPKSLSIVDTQIFDTTSFIDKDVNVESIPNISSSIEILNNVQPNDKEKGKSISKQAPNSNENEPNKTPSFVTKSFDQSIEPEKMVGNINLVPSEKSVQILESAMNDNDIENKDSALVSESSTITNTVLTYEIKKSCNFGNCTVVDTITNVLLSSSPSDLCVLEKTSEFTKSDEIPSVHEATDERAPINNMAVDKIESECNTVGKNMSLLAEADKTQNHGTDTRLPAHNEQSTILEIDNYEISSEMACKESIASQTSSNIDQASLTETIDSNKSTNILDPINDDQSLSIVTLPKIILLPNIIEDSSHCTLKYPSILTETEAHERIYSMDSVCSNTKVTDRSEIEANEPSDINNTQLYNEQIIQGDISTTTSSNTSHYLNISIDQFNAEMNTDTYAELENTSNIPNASTADSASKIPEKPVNSNMNICDNIQSTLKTHISAEITRTECQSNESTFDDVVLKSIIDKNTTYNFENTSLTEHPIGECVEDNTTHANCKPEENITSVSHDKHDTKITFMRSNNFSQDCNIISKETEPSNLVDQLHLATIKHIDQTGSDCSAKTEESLEEHKLVDNIPTSIEIVQISHSIVPIEIDSNDHGEQIPTSHLKLDTSLEDVEDNVKQKVLRIEIDSNNLDVQIPTSHLKLEASSDDAVENVKQKYLSVEIQNKDHDVQTPMPDHKLDTSLEEFENYEQQNDLTIQNYSSDHILTPHLKLDASLEDPGDNVKQKDLTINIDNNDHGVQIPMTQPKPKTSSEEFFQSFPKYVEDSSNPKYCSGIDSCSEKVIYLKQPTSNLREILEGNTKPCVFLVSANSCTDAFDRTEANNRSKEKNVCAHQEAVTGNDLSKKASNDVSSATNNNASPDILEAVNDRVVQTDMLDNNNKANSQNDHSPSPLFSYSEKLPLEIGSEEQKCVLENSVIIDQIFNDRHEVPIEAKLSPGSTKSDECDIFVEKSIREIECDQNIFERNANLVYKDDSGVILRGIEYEDPEIGTCYVFPLQSSDNSETSELLNTSLNSSIEVIRNVNDLKLQSPNSPEHETDLYGDEDLQVLLPKVTYFKRNLKRKSNMKDIILMKKRPRRNSKTIEAYNPFGLRKSKKLDVPKPTNTAIANLSYCKEFQQLIEYYDNVGFSYSITYSREFIDVNELLQDWPIKDSLGAINYAEEIDNALFADTKNEVETIKDPFELTLAEELAATNNDTNYSSDGNADETNVNVGFGEGSGRVIQNLDGGAISKFSAATLSDVKQSQPCLLSGESNDTNNLKLYQSLHQKEQLETFNRFYTCFNLKEKVRSFFNTTAIELAHLPKTVKDSLSDAAALSFPFHLYIPKTMAPRPIETIVQVVQVGQLPVSASAQNPVTCDPRVTQVSNASPSQCSVDNSPHDPQQDTRTEYTELTTADLSLPLVEGYVQHNQSLSAETQEATNLVINTENIPIQTELLKSGMKFELAEENLDDKEKGLENCQQNDSNNHVNNVEGFIYDTNNANATVETQMQALFEPKKQDVSETVPDTKPQNGSVEKTDQIAHAMNAAGITTTSETATSRAQAFVNLLTQRLRQGTVVSTPNSSNNYPKTTTINAMSLQQALAQILPPPLNHTSSENNQQSQNTLTPQVVHIVQGKSGSGNHITLVDNTQHSVITAPNATPVLHIVQNKSVPGSNSNGSPAPQANTFSGISLVDAGMQQGGNQLLHIVNTGNQKNTNATQLLKRVNLLANLANVQGSNEQKMVQFVCKSADGKSIQLNAPHQRSMVLRLQPIDPHNVQPATQKPVEDQNSSPAPNVTINTATTPNKTEIPNTQQEIKSRSVFEDNYAKFIQSSTNKSTVLEKLPKFNQAFGKSVYQDGTQKQHEINTNNLHQVNTATENTDCPPTENSMNLEHISPMTSPPLLLRKSPQTTQPQATLMQQIKQAIAPMNIQTMHGGVIYTRQIPVNIGGGQTINLITVPNTEIVEESGQKQQINHDNIEPSIIKIVPQTQSQTSNAEGTSANEENPQQNPPQPQPVLTQMRIKLPMLSKNPQMVTGARVVRPSFFQIQRNIVGGANQQVYQQLVLTAAPPLGQQTIRLPQTQARQIKIPENQSPETQMSSSTLEQLREFDMVLEQVKERSTGQPNSNSNSSFKINNPSVDTTDSPPSATSASAAETTQVLYSIGSSQPISVAYLNRKASVSTPTTSTYVRSPDSSGIADSPTSSSSQVQPQTDTAESSSSGSAAQSKIRISSRQRPRPKPHQQSAVKVTPPPKPSAQKPLEDEQTTQRILYILAEYKEQVENSPDKDKPAPRRRNNPPTNPSGSHKRKKSSSGSRRSGRDSPSDDTSRMGSEDSSCGTSQGDCNESCMDSHSPQDSPRKVPRKLSFEPEPCPTPPPKPQPQRNVIVADGQTITVARGTAGKPATAVLMPANYILPVSMVKGGQQIAIVTNRGPKLLTVGGGEGGGTNTLLLQRLIGPAGLKPVLTRPGVRQVRLPTAALHNFQAFNLASASTAHPPDSTATSGSNRNPPDLVETNRNETSSWADRSGNKPERASSPGEMEPWNLPSSADPNDYSYEETVRAQNMDRTVLDHIQDRYSPDMEAQRIFDKMFDVEAKKSYNVDSVDSPRCGYDIDASDCDDKSYQVVHKKDPTARQGRFAHVSAAALRHKYAILEHELRLQKSLSEECEDLGVDSPSASDLFPEAELLFAASPAQDHASDVPHHSHTPQPQIFTQAIQPDIDDQIATDHILQRDPIDRQELDVNLGLEDVGIVTVSEDGTQATIALDHEEFARSHPNTTFHSEPTDEGEVQPFTIAGLKTRHITSTIFHSNRAPATVLMTAPQTTVISQAAAAAAAAGAEHTHTVKYSDIDNMINSIPGTHTNNILSSVLVKDDGLTRYDNILTDSRELHLSNTASAIVHSGGNTTQVIRRVCYDENKRTANSFLMDEPDAIIAGDDAKMVAEDSSRDATLESMGGDGDDDNSSPGRHADLFWESNSASEKSEGRRPLDFSSDSDKCCKSPSYDETNSTDSSGVGAQMRLDSVIKDARGIDRSGSADGSSADDTHPPLRTYPAKRLYPTAENDLERSLSGKTRAGERSPDPEVRRRASGRGVVKRGCHCCNGAPAPSRPKKPRQKKPTTEFTN